MKWVTRERPVIDRIACPWLIARFIDKQPEFLFVPPDQVAQVAAETGAIHTTYLGSSSRMSVKAVVLTASYRNTVWIVILRYSRLQPLFVALTLIVMTLRRNRRDYWPSPWACETLARTIMRY